MAILKKPKTYGIAIDLNGHQGNAFYLLGLAQTLCKQVNVPSDPIVKEMMSGDYEHLIQVFDKHFGDFVTLYR